MAVLAVATVYSLLPAATDAAGYARPKGATPLRVAIVPAFVECTEPDKVHGPPLDFGSCTRQRPETDTTLGAPGRTGTPAQSVSHVRFGVLPGDPATAADEADLRIVMDVNDVWSNECCPYAPYAGEPPFYLALHAVLRITDRLAGGPDPAETVTDIPLHAAALCTGQLPHEATVGATCAVSTTADALVPGSVPERKRSIWEVGAVEVYDPGPDRDPDTQSDNRRAFVQGVFVP